SRLDDRISYVHQLKFKIYSRLPVLMKIHRKTAKARGLKPMVFKVSTERVEPIKNNVKFNPDFAKKVMEELSSPTKGK
ncbi:hypothetical protein, partial [Chryseobacterium sp.]